MVAGEALECATKYRMNGLQIYDYYCFFIEIGLPLLHYLIDRDHKILCATIICRHSYFFSCLQIATQLPIVIHGFQYE
jgi:hypothetical protein